MSRNTPYRSDSRTREAKAQGYPARSVFKLQEIQKKHRLLAPGQSVLDLGAAPGSWSQYAAGIVGRNGRVVSVDLSEMDAPAANVTVIQGDALDPDSLELGRLAPYDVVLSDMAPRTSGNKMRDRYLSYELAVAALGMARALGKPGSHFVAKIFMSEDFKSAKADVAKSYQTCRVVRPSATRQNSTEVFLVGLSLKVATSEES